MSSSAVLYRKPSSWSRLFGIAWIARPVLSGIVAVGIALSASAQDHVVIGQNKQLFVDDWIVASLEGVTRELGRPVKHGVVMTPTLPTEIPDPAAGINAFGFYLSPYWNAERGLFQMWYLASKREGGGLGYAESEDGMHWKKPLVAEDGKSNIVLPEVAGVTVTRDEHAGVGAPDRYKVAFFPIPENERFTYSAEARLGYSRDGLTWNFYNNGNPVTGRAADFSNQITWDPALRRYRLITRHDFGTKSEKGELRGMRIMYHSKGNNLLEHPTAWEALPPFYLSFPGMEMDADSNVPVRQIHVAPGWFYEGVCFTMVEVLVADEQRREGGDYENRHETGVWDTFIGASRTGERVNMEWVGKGIPFLPRGPAGSFDQARVGPPSNIITYNDEHWIYYAAMNERWGAVHKECRIGLAKLRLDGFVALAAGDEPGTVITKPLRIDGESLELNVDAVSGWLRVEVVAPDGEPIEGFAGEDAPTFRGANSVRFQPTWGANRSLAELLGRTVRFKIHLRNARIYALQMRE